MTKNERLLKNFKILTVTFLISAISTLLILPPILKLEFVKTFMNSTSIRLFSGIILLNLLVHILTWEKAQRLWRRYKNTRRTGNFPFIYIDIIGIYFDFTAYLAIAYLAFIISNEFQYTMSNEFNCFIFLNALIFSIWFFSSFRHKMTLPTKKEIESKNSLSDEPIISPKQDILRREEFIKALYDEIVNLPTVTSGSFTLGLHGSWGEGKTSVINLLVIKFENNHDFLVIKFEPWHFENEEAISKSFYTQIEKAIHDRFIFPDMKRAISKYQKSISTGISLSGFQFDLKFSDKSIEELKEKIEEYIDEIDKKMLIIIDDIDRLQPEEILLIFKMVRKNTNFKNTLFLLSFDPRIVQKFLEEYAKIDPDFLEKIVQKPIPLPAIEQNSIDEFLFSEIEKILKIHEFSQSSIETFKEEFLEIYEEEINKLFKTLRLAKRYINGLKATLPSIKREVNLSDFFVLECIRVFNYGLYKDIWKNPWYYIGETLKTMFTTPLSTIEVKEKKLEITKDHIENILGGHPQSRILKELLAALFPENVGDALKETRLKHLKRNRFNNRAQKRIFNENCFEKYFILQVPSFEISDEEIETIIDYWKSKKIDEQKQLIKNTILRVQNGDKRTYELLQKFTDFRERMNPQLALSFIEVIYENVHLLSKEIKEEKSPIRFSEFARAEKLLLYLINDKIEKEKIQDVLLDAALKTPEIYFAVKIIESAKNQEKYFNIYHSINLEYLLTKMSNHLKEYFIDGKKDIFDCLRENEWKEVLVQWATETYVKKNNKVVSDYVLSLVKNNPKRLSKFLLKSSDETYPPQEEITFDNFRIIYEYKKFEKIAQKFKNSESLSEEERKIINTFLGEKERDRQKAPIKIGRR